LLCLRSCPSSFVGQELACECKQNKRCPNPSLVVAAAIAAADADAGSTSLWRTLICAWSVRQGQPEQLSMALRENCGFTFLKSLRPPEHTPATSVYRACISAAALVFLSVTSGMHFMRWKVQSSRGWTLAEHFSVSQGLIKLVPNQGPASTPGQSLANGSWDLRHGLPRARKLPCLPQS